MDHPEQKKGEVLYTYTTEKDYPELLLETKRIGKLFNHRKLPVFISEAEFKEICYKQNSNKKL